MSFSGNQGDLGTCLIRSVFWSLSKMFWLNDPRQNISSRQTLFTTAPFLFLYVPPLVVHDGGIVFGPAVGLDVRVCGRFDHLPRCWARNSTGSTWPVSSLEDINKPFNKSHNFLKFFCELCNDRTGFRYLWTAGYCFDNDSLKIESTIQLSLRSFINRIPVSMWL